MRTRIRKSLDMSTAILSLALATSLPQNPAQALPVGGFGHSFGGFGHGSGGFGHSVGGFGHASAEFGHASGGFAHRSGSFGSNLGDPSRSVGGSSHSMELHRGFAHSGPTGSTFVVGHDARHSFGHYPAFASKRMDSHAVMVADRTSRPQTTPPPTTQEKPATTGPSNREPQIERPDPQTTIERYPDGRQFVMVRDKDFSLIKQTVFDPKAGLTTITVNNGDGTETIRQFDRNGTKIAEETTRALYPLWRPNGATSPRADQAMGHKEDAHRGSSSSRWTQREWSDPHTPTAHGLS
jgi:hypothetical protein